jgi:hypothetical protein
MSEALDPLRIHRRQHNQPMASKSSMKSAAVLIEIYVPSLALALAATNACNWIPPTMCSGERPRREHPQHRS